MAKRKIIEIDRDLCNGCGACTTACDEAALELDDEGKAVLVKELYCDGMGMCLNVCPTGALTVVERESPTYDYQATVQHVQQARGSEAVEAVHKPEAAGGGAPAADKAGAESGEGAAGPDAVAPAQSELSQWPIQLHLISPAAPYFHGADLLVAADCTAFALGTFHSDLLKGRKMVIACPKLDETGPYLEKLVALIRDAGLKSVTIAIMTVPCCTGLERMVKQAVALAGVDVPVKTVVVGIDGNIAGER
jgi:Pyruvate/2-oxoacid:ferredoxin oxidoreductase delta subunit